MLLCCRRSTWSSIQTQTHRDYSLGTEEKPKQASFRCSCMESKASTTLQGGRKAAREVFNVFNDSLPKLHLPVSSGVKDGLVGRRERCRNSHHRHFCLPSLMSPLSSWGHTARVWWDKVTQAKFSRANKSLLSKCPNSPPHVPGPHGLTLMASEARDREIRHCRKSESRIRVQRSPFPRSNSFKGGKGRQNGSFLEIPQNMANIEGMSFPFGCMAEVQHLEVVSFQELTDLHRHKIFCKWRWQCCQELQPANNFPCKTLLLLG